MVDIDEIIRRFEEEQRQRVERSRQRQEESDLAWAHRMAQMAANVAEIGWRNTDCVLSVDTIKELAYEQTMNKYGFHKRWSR